MEMNNETFKALELTERELNKMYRRILRVTMHKKSYHLAVLVSKIESAIGAVSLAIER